MDKLFNFTCVVIGIAGGACAQILGGFDGLIYALVILMILDYITGLIKGIYFKRLSSEAGFRGILKKVLIVIMVALANTVQELLGVKAAIRETVIMFYTANEAVSILENIAEVMPNMPQGLKNMLLKIRDNTDISQE